MPRKEKPTYETEQEVFPTRLREIMERRGWNQDTLAKAISEGYLPIKRQTISLYTTGQSAPDTARLTALSKVLGVSADYLLGVSEDPSPDPDHVVACRYTGLSPQTVSALHAMGYEREALDRFIGARAFTRFMLALLDVPELAAQVRREEGYMKTDLKRFRVEEWERNKMKLDLSKFHAQEALFAVFAELEEGG